MAKEYSDVNKGALFGNTRKREGRKDPDLQGRLNIDGVEHWLSAWFFTYEDKSGATKRGINISIGERVEPKPAAPKAGGFDDDNDIPF